MTPDLHDDVGRSGRPWRASGKAAAARRGSLVVHVLVLTGCVIALAGCATGGDGEPGTAIRWPWSPTLEDVDWRPVQVLGKPVPETSAGALVRLDAAQSRFLATVGCNRLLGAYERRGEKLRLTPGVSTRMACPGPVGDAERRLVGALGATTGYRIVDGRLELLGGRSVLAVLERR